MIDVHSKDEAGEPSGPIEQKRQFVTFALSGQHYCVDIMLVREIRMIQSITGLPGAPDYVRGVINLRGSIVPVYDLRKKFGQGATTLLANHPAVIVSVEGKLCGLLVDEVLDIITAANSEVASLPDNDGEKRNPFFQGLITQPEALFIVVDIDRFVDRTEIRDAETVQ
jgi:purine-binding chemotaxis protein CheW